MVAKDTRYGSETYRPYLDIERIINVQSACSVNRGHDQIFNVCKMIKVINPFFNNNFSKFFTVIFKINIYHLQYIYDTIWVLYFSEHCQTILESMLKFPILNDVHWLVWCDQFAAIVF